MVGTVVDTRCPQCLGTGLISAQDSDTLLATDTISKASAGASAVIITAPKVPSPVVVKIASKGK